MTPDELVAAGPDPEGARPRLERFRELGGELPAGDDAAALLAALLGSGSFLGDLLLAEVSRFPALARDPHLRAPKPHDVATSEVRALAAGAADFAELQRRLRRHRAREMLRLGARELGWGTTAEVAGELADLADACLDAAVALCDSELRAAHGMPRPAVLPAGAEGAGEPPASGFAVIALGKLGGRELNFCSDVDLMFVYASDEGDIPGTALSAHEYFARLAQRVTRALDEVTGDGFVFRVDLRLRPEGRGGPICNSLAAAESYYETFGRTWERQALLRARPAAGDRALGERFLASVEPFVYPRSVGPSLLDEVRALRRLYHREAATGVFDVKLDPGGIRDVELVAQVLQLIHAGHQPELRERGTPAALHKLGVAGLLSGDEVRALSGAYRFWRHVEHLLQIEHGAQVHALPGDDPGRLRLARRAGFGALADLDVAVAAHRAAVSAIASTLGEPAHAPSSLVLRLLDAASPRERLLADLGAAGFADAEAGADNLDLARGRLPPEWLDEAISSPDPDRALAHFRDLALRGSLGVFALLREEPRLLRMLAGLFGTSERLSCHLLAHPETWQPLADGLGSPRPSGEEGEPDSLWWRRTLGARLAGLDVESALHEMRRYQAAEILRIGLHDVAGNLPAEEVSRQLGALAEACLAEAARLVGDALAARFGRPGADLHVLAFGSFGAGEMRYGSDLDLVLLYSRPGATDRGTDHGEWFARFAQRLIGALGALMEEGRLYEVDTRLRPSGAQGLLVTTADAFARYHEDEAAPWERVALLRARPVCAWPPDGQGAPALADIAYRPPADRDRFRAELLRMRRRIESERAAEGLHLRLSPGGLADLEFLAAWGQLEHGAGDAALRTPSTLGALTRLAARGDGPAHAVDDHGFLQRAILRHRLLTGESDDRLTPPDRARLARSLDTTDARLAAELESRMRRVRAALTAALA